jgi:hypothetical protein
MTPEEIAEKELTKKKGCGCWFSNSVSPGRHRSRESGPLLKQFYLLPSQLGFFGGHSGIGPSSA